MKWECSFFRMLSSQQTVSRITPIGARYELVPSRRLYVLFDPAAVPDPQKEDLVAAWLALGDSSEEEKAPEPEDGEDEGAGDGEVDFDNVPLDAESEHDASSSSSSTSSSSTSSGEESHGAPIEAPPSRLEASRQHGWVSGPDDVEVVLPEGTITYYSGSKNFVAVCTRAAHAVADGERTCLRIRMGEEGRSRASGRPCGGLCAWLQQCNHCASRDAHVDEVRINRQVRRDSRDHLKTVPNGLALLSRERDRRPNEADEPFRNP